MCAFERSEKGMDFKMKNEGFLSKANAKNNTAGITIIALVVTIIVILILTGVSISRMISDDGILQHSKIAQQKMEEYEQKKKTQSEENNIIQQRSYVNTKNIVFESEEMEFDGTYKEDTGIKLFDEENNYKDFEITFTFSDKVFSNANLATLLNSMDESNKNYPGFNVRMEKDNIRVVGGSGRTISDYTGKTLCISRYDGVIYTSIDGETPVKLMNNPENTFETTVVFGCSVMYNDGEIYYDRYFKGEIFDVSIKIFEQSKLASKVSRLVYSKANMQTGTYTINNAYIDTGIKLFDETNWGKDFEVSFKIDDIGTNENQATIFNALLEQKPYPGVLVRYQGSKVHIEGNYLEEDGVSNKTVYVDKNPNEVSQITIKRIKNILYYSINNSAEDIELMSCEKVNKHNIPVTFGCRYTNG